MNRRKFLVGSGGALGVAAGFTETAQATTPQDIPALARSMDSGARPLDTQSNDLTPYSGTWSDTLLRHLLRRSMFGVPFSQFQAAQQLGGMSAVIDKLLSDLPLPPEPATYVDSIVQIDQTLAATDKYAAGQNQQRLEANHEQQVANWWMDLILKENLSIRERMTLLWSNHFVIGTDVVRLAGYAYTYNQTLRKNALGNLKSFVHDISVDPAMLLYLNGNQNYDGNPPPGTSGSKGTNINENFARELQELFTLGISDPVSGLANYTETDIQNAAKALTGWAPTTSAPFVGTFYPNSHNSGSKTFLGQTGNWTLDDIINIIFTYKGPSGTNAPGFNAAYWFCQKIYMEFVYYVPNISVVTAMANVMLQNNFEIKPVLQALLSSDHFYDPIVQNAQLKSPVTFIAGLIREFGLTYTPFSGADLPITGHEKNNANINIYGDTNPTLSYLVFTVGAFLGQQLLLPPNVKGWPGGHNWISTGTFQAHEGDSAGFLAFPPNFDGSQTRNSIKIEFTSPTAWANAIPNSSTLTIHQITLDLTANILNKALGPLESDALYSSINPLNLPDSDNYLTDANVATFAIALASLPEFQLY